MFLFLLPLFTSFNFFLQGTGIACTPPIWFGVVCMDGEVTELDLVCFFLFILLLLYYSLSF